MKKPKLRELIEAIKALIVGPYTSKFPKVMPVIPDGYHGKPEFDEKECIGCGACAEACPARAIDVIDNLDTRKRTLLHDQTRCIFCGQCESYCTTVKGIKLTKEWELSTYDRSTARTQIDKALVLCECCGGVVACKDHLLWIADKVGTAAFTNPTLQLTRDMERFGIEVHPGKAIHPRSSHMKILCPNCRRDVIMKEQW